MKKLFCILSVLTIVSPAFAEDPAPTPTAVGTGTTPSSFVTQPTGDAKAAVLGGSPLYELIMANSSTDNNAASAGYVKGAYNASIKAINKVADIKQDMLSASNVTESGTGTVITGVSASNGSVTVTRGNVTIPAGTGNNATSAGISIE